MSMLTDIYYKKTERCNKYPAMLATKNVPQMPLLTVKADEFDSQWILKHALEEPVLLVGSNEDMGITLLDRDVKLSQVATLLGPNTPVKIIEVGLQSEITGKTFAEYATYLEKRGPKHKVLNLISLEISATPLTAHIEAPRFVREEVDWIDSIWPLERRARGGDYPQVQKYLLTGMAGSYTDFHIDFGVSEQGNERSILSFTILTLIVTLTFIDFIFNDRAHQYGTVWCGVASGFILSHLRPLT